MNILRSFLFNFHKPLPTDVPPELVLKSTEYSLPQHQQQQPPHPPKSALSKQELRNRIKGLVFGAALGDAFGLATEFLTKQQATETYPTTNPLSFSNFLRDTHRARWREGDFTDDTDQMLVILNTLLEVDLLRLDQLAFAQNLRAWSKHGLVALNKPPFGIGMSVGQAIRSPDFLSNPSTSAFRVWQKSGFRMAANGAVMRTAILGVPYFWDESVVMKQTVDAALVTHADPRCILSCIVVTFLVARMLQGKLGSLEKGSSSDDLGGSSSSSHQDPSCTALIQDILQNLSLPILNMYKDASIPFDATHHNKQLTELFAFPESLQALELDESNSIGYTFKCLGAALYCFMQPLSDSGLEEENSRLFTRVITELVMEAGDADTNACVAGALLGCRIGFSSLPKHWLESLKHKEYLDQQVEALCIALFHEME
ncbi:ADP-ribosylation/Crystallin J1 [Obelidium mucronatum]|nr:ADP-ribosylation/Crystallin J1 [Obelidium mucronatum]